MASNGFLLFIFIIQSSLGEKFDIREEKLKAKTLFSQNDVIEFTKKLGVMGKSFGENWIVMSDGDGKPVFSSMDSTEAADVRMSPSAEEVSQRVMFVLYTPEEPSGVVFQSSTFEDIEISPDRPTIIICHGWMAKESSSITQDIKDAYLKFSKSNVIAVNWEYFAQDYLYVFAVSSIKPIGNLIGRLIDDMVSVKGLKYKDIHIVGHSLGAHAAGFAGSSTKEKVGRITGLDPALPGFQYVADTDGRLDKSDAEFVDVIHTCAGILGVTITSGHVDFYPNGGSSGQPGCKIEGFNPVNAEVCSHSRAHEFFSESIDPNSKFTAIKCKNWEEYKQHECEISFERMGEYVSRNASGVYYLKTNAESPFWMGTLGTIY